MNLQTNRLPTGGRINRDKSFKFTFDGNQYSAFEGDTLASALLANNVLVMARSFKYHRPRGVVTAGSHEPNALFELHYDGYHEPNSRATTVLAEPGMIAKSQNAWPSLNFDVMEINRLFSPVFVAGFYYKTFMWPGLKGWMLYEKLIRRAAGLGSAASQSDNDTYQSNHLFTDILIVGGGVSGLSSALQYANKGKNVLLVDENPTLGGRLNFSPSDKEQVLKESLLAELLAHKNITVLNRTTLFGAYDHGVFGAVETHFSKGLESELISKKHSKPRQTYHKILAQKVVYATGATERPLLFKNNDLPGVMLSEALQRYVLEYAVLPGKHVVFATLNDSVYALANYLDELGVTVSIIDYRNESSIQEGDCSEKQKAMQSRTINIYHNAKIIKAHGWKRVKRIEIEYNGNKRSLSADVIAMSGGFTPNVNLQCHLGAKPFYDDTIDALVIDNQKGSESNGAASAKSSSHQCPSETIGSAAGIWKTDDKMLSAKLACESKDINHLRQNSIAQDNRLSLYKVDDKAFLDFQHDVTNKDIQLAGLEGFNSVEHSKRYTTLGMATDQGKLSNFNALKLMALYQKRPINEVGTTTYRPPYTPITMGALASTKIDESLKPIRRIPTYDCHINDGTVFTPSGLWLRPEYHPQSINEGKDQSYRRETAHVRKHVGMIDVSTLGKITVQGPDAAEFINRLYVNGMKKLGIGKIRYGIMLREDGFPFDDGTVMRLGENDFFVTTTTAYAANVLLHMEHLLQVVWPDLKVHVNTATDQWATIAVAGPKSRDCLQAVFPNMDLSERHLPFMSFVDENINGIMVRIARISFSGELGFEVMIEAKYAESLWNNIAEVGKAFNIKPYGTEAMGALRIEKGFITHAEMDGRVTLQQMGMHSMMSQIKPDFIGKYYANNRLTESKGTHQLIGIVTDKTNSFGPGCHLVHDAIDFNELDSIENQNLSKGWISSSTYSPALDKFIALGYLIDGRDKINESIYVVSPIENKSYKAVVVSPQFLDNAPQQKGAE